MTGDMPIPVLVVFGPTAVGKTDLAIRLAQQFNGEIVSADSRQIYRYMDIGTAKPTAEQRAAAVHHLIDLVDPDQTLSVAEFQKLAEAAIAAVHARGRLALLVGGTGQYITALLEGWRAPQVAPIPELRRQLEDEARDRGSAVLYERLLAADPAARGLIHPHNTRRIIRALEVIAQTGQPFSALRAKQPPPYALFQIGVTLERAALYRRADARLDAMLAAGFADEVRMLLERGYDRQLPSMSGLGYAQLAAHWLDGVPLAEAVQRTRTATHDFIRRQYTWFRHHDHGAPVHWFDQANAAIDALTASVDRWLAELRKRDHEAQ
ncbi:MAG: tRNA (adenosine(37)-N6)-dimethylallyltransferase MiaA [Candidatus Flexifilum sp.]